MSSRSATLLLVVIVALATADAFHSTYFFAQYFRTPLFPETPLFKFAFFAVWLPIEIVEVWCGLRGGYLSLRRRNLDTGYFSAFALLACLSFKVDRVGLGWSALSLSFTFGGPRLAMGANAVGIALVIWLERARTRERPLSQRPLSTPASDESRQVDKN